MLGLLQTRRVCMLGAAVQPCARKVRDIVFGALYRSSSSKSVKQVGTAMWRG